MRQLFLPILLSFLLGCKPNESKVELKTMTLVEGGLLHFGKDEGKENERPEIELFVPSFYLDKSEVSNADFRKFVASEQYTTSAEKAGSSMIFTDRWEIKKSTSWKNHPYGEATLPSNFDSLPVVHVSWYDASAYCEWKNKRLPTEQEFEFVIENYGTKQFNIWEGKYPNQNTLEDGYYWTAPVGSFETNALGISDLEGNVWEWTADNYHYNIHEILALNAPDTSAVWMKASYDPTSENPNEECKVIKGGSFLCHSSYCCGYKPEARMPAKPNSSYFHTGFRCACDL